MKTNGSIVQLIMCVFTGVLYTSAQVSNTGTVEDSIFISLLFIATAMLLFSMESFNNYLKTNGIKYYGMIGNSDDSEEAKKLHEKLMQLLTDRKRQIFSGIAYGTTVSSVAFLLVWPEHTPLRIFLSLYIWAINYTTGVAFYNMICFLLMSKKMSSILPVSLWMPNTPPVRFLMSMTKTVGMITSFYVSICITSIIFSVIPIQNLVGTYAVFSLVCILSSIAIPAVSIANRRSRSKTQTLDEMDERILNEYQRLSGLESKSIPSAEFETLQHMIQLRDRVIKTPCWPFRIGTITTGLIVILVSSIPVFIQYGMEWLTK